MNDKLHISLPIIVEGKYDKIKLSSLLEANIITTDGFGIFNNREKLALIRRLAENSGVIIVTDSDGAGLVIRNYFKSVLPPELIHHVYIPAIRGKEKRKAAPSKEGLIGVEGMDAAFLRTAFEPWIDGADTSQSFSPMTKAELFAMGLSGGDCSAKLRYDLCEKLRLPLNLSSGALLAAINMLGLRAEVEAFAEKHNENYEKA